MIILPYIQLNNVYKDNEKSRYCETGSFIITLSTIENLISNYWNKPWERSNSCARESSALYSEYISQGGSIKIAHIINYSKQSTGMKFAEQW